MDVSMLNVNLNSCNNDCYFVISLQCQSERT